VASGREAVSAGVRSDTPEVAGVAVKLAVKAALVLPQG
jgi:hypothetical protein